jgi:regulator of sigma E protease
MITLLAFIVAIGVLVTFHELGHYCVARLCGVKVLRFSIGFGRPLATWNMFDTEWALCPIPLGGYVRMLDDREMPVPADQLHRSFNVKPAWQRMAIVFAGPFANLLLAALLYWAVIAHGVVQLHPWVGTVVQDSPAASAGFVPGDRIVAVDGSPVDDWHAVRLALVDALPGRNTSLPIDVIAPTGARQVRQIDVARFSPSQAHAFESGDVGVLAARYQPVVGALEEGGVAMKAGLRVGDRLVAVDGRQVSDWQGWVATVRDNPGKLLTLSVLRQGKSLTIALRPALVESGDGFAGHVGVSPQMDEGWVQTLRFTRHYDIGQAGREAVIKTLSTSWMSLKFLGRMLTGMSSMDNLSGPLVIASVAGQSAREGLIAYLEFLALISVSIGVLNLLPIPVLDGGHLMYYTAELIRGRPLSERVQRLGYRVGFALLIALMAFAMLNDISRLLGG